MCSEHGMNKFNLLILSLTDLVLQDSSLNSTVHLESDSTSQKILNLITHISEGSFAVDSKCGMGKFSIR